MELYVGNALCFVITLGHLQVQNQCASEYQLLGYQQGRSIALVPYWWASPMESRLLN